MKKLILAVIIVFTAAYGFSQNEIDAFRFSEAFYGGTARAMSMGGAFGALGADLSTASTNPAGIGVYKQSSITFAPMVVMTNVEADFNGTNAANDKLTMTVANVGGVFGFRNENSPLKSFNLAFGYNRYNEYGQNYLINGINDKGSLMDSYMLEANGTHPENLNSFTTFLAWNTWLLDTVPGTLNYTNPLWWALPADQTPQYGQTVTKSSQVKGGAGETFFTAALNYNDFFYFGATVGVQSFNYNHLTVYTEENFVDNDDLESFRYTEHLTDNGTGVNFKAGILLKPLKFVRFGGAFHSPTYFTIYDKYDITMESFWASPDINGVYDYYSSSPVNDYTFNLLTPMRLMGNLGFVICDFALIDVDYEYVDYSSMRLSANDYLFTEENNAIRNDFKPTHNFKGGFEIRHGMMSVRGGYAYYGNPYRNSNVYEKTQITGGIGFANEYLFVDFAYIHDFHKYNQYLYNGYVDEPVPEMSKLSGLINVTMGVRF